MVNADRGAAYHPDQVQVAPSGKGTALGGGASVTANQKVVNDMELLEGKSFSMVFGKDGNLVNYEGPIF